VTTCRVSVAVLGWILAALAACDSSPSAPSSGVTLGPEFTLKPGESATVLGTDLRISFDKVVEDSRCPADALCVRAGDALVALQASWKDGDAHFQLRTVAGSDVASAGAYRVRLVRVEPYPVSSHAIAPGDYRSVLAVTR
jgi:hypothetical protein